jgi:hypothetical protein
MSNRVCAITIVANVMTAQNTVLASAPICIEAEML